MRIKQEFAEVRKSEIIDYRSKYFIVSEGSTSEPRYFDGLGKTVISENVKIINILRDYATANNSNPTFITEILKEFIVNTIDGQITVREIKNKILNWVHEYAPKLDITEIFDKLNKLYKNDNYKISYEDLDELFFQLFKSEIYIDLAKNFSKYFEAQGVTYSPTRDSLNMVVDRDKDSFTEKQFDDVVNFCKDNKVNFYVSNPNFEFWLLLHFEDVDTEDRQIMFENKKVNNSGRRYLEKRLYDICKYKKNKLRFSEFEPFITDAIKREKNFSEDIFELKNNLGSNVGLLIEKMLKEK